MWDAERQASVKTYYIADEGAQEVNSAIMRVKDRFMEKRTSMFPLLA